MSEHDDFEEKALDHLEKMSAAYRRAMEHFAFYGENSPELVTLLDLRGNVVFSADPVTMKDWLIINPQEAGYEIRFHPGDKIVTIDYFLGMMETP